MLDANEIIHATGANRYHISLVFTAKENTALGGIKMRALVVLTLCILTYASACPTQLEYEPLQEFSVDKERITVSGISAGAAFATQVWDRFCKMGQNDEGL